MDLLSANDRPGEYPASLYAATANTSPEFSSLKSDVRTDVCVIGAGYTGLSTALHLAQRGVSVVVLEANRVGWGASGRNGGQVGSGQRLDPLEMEQFVGASAARRLWDMSVEATNLVRELINTHEIACDYRPGVLHSVIRPRDVDGCRAYVDHLHGEYGHEAVRFVDRDELREMLGTEMYQAGSLDRSAGHLHPLNYAIGLANAAKGAGAKIFENSRVTGISEGLVSTETGTVRADNVVLACNGYLGDLAGEVAERVMSINNFIVATEPLGQDKARSLIRDNVAVADSKFVVNYYRLSPDHRLIFGGGETYGYRFPKDIARLVRPNMLEVYPQLKDTRIDYAWGGTLAITLNRMPHFMQVSKHVTSASGYSGHGIAIATLAGRLLAEKLTGNSTNFDLFADFPNQRFPGGTRFRSGLLALAMTWYSLRDRF